MLRNNLPGTLSARLLFLKLIFVALSVIIKGYGGILWEFGLSRARLVLNANTR
jgi:hypothetical protein